MNREQLTNALERLAEPVCRAHGVELVQLRITTQRGGRGVVQVIIDRERVDGVETASGVTLEDCTSVSRDLSTALDVHEDLVAGSYHLEVSSPGLERPLVKLRDFERFAGREATIRVKTPRDGRRKFQGKLLGVSDSQIEIDLDGTPVRIPHEEIDRANLVYRF